MQTGNTWPWPYQMDALLASPQHHRLLMENDKVRVMDTCIPPGESTSLHTHQWPASLYIISWSDCIRYDGDGEIIFNSATLPVQPAIFSVMWTEPLPPHILKNVGNKELHIISVEIKTGVL